MGLCAMTCMYTYTCILARHNVIGRTIRVLHYDLTEYALFYMRAQSGKLKLKTNNFFVNKKTKSV